MRQSAHSAQGSIASLVGKRVARFLPRVVGAWLAGVYDNDKPVHQSALESITRVFATDEKRNAIWKVFQSSIIDFVDDVILQQTPQTLSDERTVKPEDAQAKYARVVGTAILLLNRILGMVIKSRIYCQNNIADSTFREHHKRGSPERSAEDRDHTREQNTMDILLS